ncbi:MAG: STAS domain-containing protein [Gammaproteobacteria bacterium]|nr:STAS domain-containing protein [Gammaproteobacteria bacterium]MBU1488889.1 STAS domain-containing protein [Gammaproteobacteria bacterium]MBU2067444.1 STAS domain-containing protein [Gammaproteobacteria bacterium]MBU2138879.1 STAS domain-containing protein [Gammaproteobacteria bacterium]MBU2216702.1 STAS domain-containing protein [Gammaproteobacteria bacterium]
MSSASAENLYRILPLEGSLSIYSATEHMGLLLQVLAPDAEVELDLSAIDELDCAGLQLLVLAKQEAGRIGCDLRLSNHSPAVIEAFELSGLGTFFGDPILIKPASE